MGFVTLADTICVTIKPPTGRERSRAIRRPASIQLWN
jgi:hypothetical protein